MESRVVSAIPVRGGDTLWRRIAAQTVEWKLHWLLRLGVFLEFVGHGACGVHGKAAWLPYFQVFGIPEGPAWKLMPVVGMMDIALGLTALFTPRRALLFYLASWGLFTALLRPAAGESGWECVERAYNWGVPLSLLLLQGFGTSWNSWIAKLQPNPLSTDRAQRLGWLLRTIVALMLVGHGALGALVGKASWLGFYQAAGLGALGLPLEDIRTAIGFFEIGLGITALFATHTAFFAFVCVWKLATESLHLVAGAKLACWEVIERGGSYVAPLAALCLYRYLYSSETRKEFPNVAPWWKAEDPTVRSRVTKSV